MFLAFNPADIINVPFGWLMDLLYRLTTNYGVALILFAVIVKIILTPVTAKGKKSMMKMSRLTPQLNAIQERYANDKQKQSEAVQELYKRENVSMMGGCLWSLVPLLILIPLYQVVRQPLVYMLHLSTEDAAAIVTIVKEALPDLFSGRNSYYEQMVAAANIPQFAEAIQAALPEVSQRVLNGLNFKFLGIDLSTVPDFSNISFTWAFIGPLLFPVLSAASQVLSGVINQKVNNSLVTNSKGVQDTEAAQKSQSAQSGKVMMWTMPLISLWIGVTIPVALSLYWFIQGVESLVVDNLLTIKYRKIYDAEDAERLAQAMKEEQIEAEKELQRALKRAANPDGITQNTSKKKLQQQQKQAEEAAKAAAAKEYAAKKGIVEETEQEETTAPSGIASRPYCKGRAYDPNRYRNTTEEN